jgi:hypothetical protein
MYRVVFWFAIITSALPLLALEPPTMDLSLAPGAPDMPVIIRTKDGDKKLISIEGAVGINSHIIGMSCHCDFPETAAPVNFKDANPTLYVAFKGSIRGRIFLVKTEPENRLGTRSVRMGVIDFFGTSSSVEFPDMEWVIPTTNKEVRPGIWELKPKAPLSSGEYGIFRYLGKNLFELYDFGIDAGQKAKVYDSETGYWITPK